MKVERVRTTLTIDLDIPEGYEVVDFRAPKHGEWYMTYDNGYITAQMKTGTIGEALFDSCPSPRFILRKKRWRARYNESYWCVNMYGEVQRNGEIGSEGDHSRYEIGNYFKTKEAAEDAAAQLKKVWKKFHENSSR